MKDIFEPIFKDLMYEQDVLVTAAQDSTHHGTRNIVSMESS
jgi:hypothetical protein